MKERFIALFEQAQQKEFISFLQSLSPTEKKELVPLIKKLIKEYLSFNRVPTGPNSSRYDQKANETQNAILLIAGFVCFNRADFERTIGSSQILEKKLLDEVIDWYCPGWFSDFVNGLAVDEFILYPDYSQAVELMEQGYLLASKELIARLLPAVIYKSETRVDYYVPERLLEHPITLREHIWLLFEVESNIYHAGRWLRNVIGGSEDDGYSAWGSAIKKYIGEGRLDRGRVLRESLYACNRNFNKLASGWFIDLFTKLDPSREELLGLQNELYAVLGSSHSKSVNTVLQYVKKLMAEKEFALAGFLDHVPVLLSSSTKSVVAATLGILEKLPAAQSGDGLMISRAVMQVFVQTDDGLQAKAAKIIVGHKMADQLKEELHAFSGSMTSSARRLLEGLLQGQQAEPVVSTGIEEGLVAPTGLKPIPAIENVDDLVFIVSQALDNNNDWVIDVVPAALVAWITKLEGAVIAQLEPVLQRALKLIKTGTSGAQGVLDYMLAVFLIDVCVWLVKNRGSDAAVLDKLFNVHKQQQNDGQVAYWQNIGERTSYLASFGVDEKNNIYLHHKHLLLLALYRIWDSKSLPLLCIPTHEPGWIAPEVLVNRLSMYQQADQWPDEVEMQVAVLRCYLDDTVGAITVAEEKLQGECLRLCLFLFGKHPEPQGPFEHPDAWLAVSLALPEKRQYASLEPLGFYNEPFSWYTGQFSWEAIDEEYISERFDYEQKKNVPYTGRRQLINVHFPKREEKEPVLLYDLFRFEYRFQDNEPNDFRRLLLLSPTNPEPLLALVLRESLQYSTFWQVSDNKSVIAMLQGLHEIWGKPGNMAHVFVGACMLCGDKTAAGIAAEIWLQQAPLDKIDSAYLGKVIGLLERANYAPLKRFTDMVHQRLMRVSVQHNQLLQILIGHALLELPDEPVTNLKKLLEIFLDLLDINKATISNEGLKDKLRAWQQHASVKKITSQLITLSA